MRNENRGIFSEMESFMDMLINLISFLCAYVILIILNEDIIDLFHPLTVIILVFNMLMASFVYHLLNLYRPSRYMKPFRPLPEIFKVNLIYFGTLAVISALTVRASYRSFILLWILFSAIFSTAILSFKRRVIKIVLSFLRTKEYQLRRVIIVGDNTSSAKDYIKEVTSDSQYAIMIMGYVGGGSELGDCGIDKLGGFEQLSAVLDKYCPTDAVFAIDSYDKDKLISLVNMCDDRCVKVYFLPVIYGFFKNSRQIEQIGSVPLINIHATPLDNIANAVLKRIFDIIAALLLIILTSPIMIFAAAGVYISSPGPILFKQKRVGKLGRCFTMLKFRSMRVNNESNRAWTTDSDPRKTRFGAFIRRFAIDELPQLFNVLSGTMSLVGPRPEMPIFVNRFKEIIPLYMVKHYVKPGITGLAQIKGLRGDTSIESRIAEDISYIENWSFMLDLNILIQTPIKLINKNEKYSPEEQ